MALFPSLSPFPVRCVRFVCGLFIHSRRCFNAPRRSGQIDYGWLEAGPSLPNTYTTWPDDRFCPRLLQHANLVQNALFCYSFSVWVRRPGGGTGCFLCYIPPVRLIRAHGVRGGFIGLNYFNGKTAIEVCD